MSSLPSHTVNTYRALSVAIARTAATRIVLGQTIALSEPITFPERHTIVTGAHGFVQQGAATIQFDALLEADHRQVFFGFSPGDITGSFRRDVVHPVWWGAYARLTTYPTIGDTTSRDDIAINCAIQATPANNPGGVVELDAGSYYVARPLDMSGRNCELRGMGAGRTLIVATSGWTADTWRNDAYFGSASHSSMVWFGSTTPATIQSFNGTVKHLGINAYYACTANPTKFISGISTYGWIEEHTVVENVSISYFSGYGIGGLSHPSDSALQRVINGLVIKDFWILSGMHRYAIPIAIGQYSTVASVTSGTIDMTTDGTQPIIDTGIWAQGMHTTVDNVHIESVRTGVMVRGSNSQNQAVILRGVDMLLGYDSNMTAGGSIVTTTRLADVAAGDYSSVYNWGTLLLIDGAVDGTFGAANVRTNTNLPSHMRVQAEAISGTNVKYLVRDPIMGASIATWGTVSENAHVGTMGRYYRSSPFRPYPNNAEYYYSSGGSVGTFPSDGKVYREILI
jgi:hypothetical protein